MSDAPPKDAIRDAATIILVRREGETARILMGQRGKSAAFMPSKFVFPGGAVDAEDAKLADTPELPGELETMLKRRAPEHLARPLALAAVRELWEETGLALAHRAGPAEAGVSDPSWVRFYEQGFRPAIDRLSMIFRAITPPGRPRRFDARFFLAEAGDIQTDLDDFSNAEDELSHLSWLTITEARKLDLPFVTEIVLAEIEARLQGDARPVPFFHHSEGKSFLSPA